MTNLRIPYGSGDNLFPYSQAGFLSARAGLKER
jgi:hypothetical protein